MSNLTVVPAPQIAAVTLAPGNDSFAIRGGAAQNAFRSGAPFQPRMFAGAITYTLGGTPITFAQRAPHGKGCCRRFRTFYELVPSSVVVDFNNTSMLLTYDSVTTRTSPPPARLRSWP